MSESQRDAGLVRAVGPWGLAASIVNMVVGAGIFVVPGALAGSVGPYGPLVFLACAVGVGSVALCFAEGGSRVPTSGGAYGYIEATFGPLSGYVAATLLWVSDVLACGGIVAALADVAASLLPAAWGGPVRAAVIVLVVLGVALVNVGGVARGTRLVAATTLAKIVPLALFVLVGAVVMHGENLVHAATTSAGGLGRAVLLASFAFTGMESALSASGEVTDPARTIPRALAWAMSFVTVLYVAVQVVAQGVLGSELGSSAAPLADAMARVSPALRAVILAGGAISMFGFISGDLLATPRVLFALARDGLLPRALGRVHPRTHAPHVAILGYAALVVALAWTGTFAELAVLSTLAVAPLYVAGCAAASLLARRGVARAGPPLALRGLGAAALTGILSMLALIALASRAEILGLLAVMAMSVVAYALRRRVTASRAW